MDDGQLLAEMLPVLELDLQIVRAFDPSDTDGIAQFRRVGRRAAHQLGHRGSRINPILTGATTGRSSS